MLPSAQSRSRPGNESGSSDQGGLPHVRRERSPGHHRYSQRRQRSEIRARTQLEGERADPHCPHLAAVRISEAGIRAAVTIAAKPIAVAAEIPGYGCRQTDGVGADRRRVWTFGRAWKRLHSARPFVSLSLRGGWVLSRL